jgi:fusion and transport protein UGO1
MESVQKMFNDNLYRYFSVLLSQPLDVGKTVLQVRSQGAAGTTPVSVAEDVRSRASSYRGSVYSDVWRLRPL